MIRTSILSAGLALLSTTAFAGNLAAPIIVAPVAQPQQMTIVPTRDWSGFYLGGQYVTGDTGDGITTFDTDGFGVHAGYLHDLGSFVIGGELDYDALTLDAGPDIDADVVRLKAIAGYDLGSFMPYLTAGVAAIDLDSGFSDTVGFYGLGGTYAFNNNFRLGGEYLVQDTDDFDGGGVFEADTFSIRMSYGF